MKHAVWSVLLCFVIVGHTLAQADCPAIVEDALRITAEACTALSRNQACYGNVTLQAEPQTGAAFTFEQTGDIVNLVDVASLSLSPMTEDAWGVALMLLQANLPDTVPGQNVAMVLFGEVNITNAVPTEAAIEPTPEPRPIVFTVIAISSINVRGGPSTSDAIVASLGAGESVPTDGRNEDGTWLHVRFEDGTTGWVFAELVSVDGDISLLPVTDGAAPIATAEAPAEPVYAPMQAFYFHSSIGDSGCAEAPDSGMLIQTPQGVGTINLVVNEVEITLGSTAYLQAGDGEMTVSVIEGDGSVSASDATVMVPAGTRARIPLDSNSAASGVPVGPEPYDAAALGALPLGLLPQTVSVATPLSEDEIAALSQLREGAWTLTGSVINSCGAAADFSLELEVVDGQFVEPIDAAGLGAGHAIPINEAIRTQGLRIPGEYVVETETDVNASAPVIGTMTMNIISATRIEVNEVVVWEIQTCPTNTWEYVLTADE